MQTPANPQRRRLLGAGAVLCTLSMRPAQASSDELDAAVRAFAGQAPMREGRVRIEIEPLVENGNTVPIAVEVDSAMTPADHVQAIALFNERNPQREVAVFHLGPRSGRARVGTRIRLATSQRLVAVARMSDGSHWSARADVIVTLAGCLEG